jgi:DNA polymerase-3 subunit epsilon
MHAPRIPQQTPHPWPEAYPEGYAVVDVETTGLGRQDRVVSAAVYRLDARGEVEDHWYSPVNPERDPGPVWIHGLTSEALADAPLFGEIAAELAERLAGRVLVAHNAVFDWNMLSREYARAGSSAPVEHRLCTIVLAKTLELPLANHRLESFAAYHGVRQRRAHHALDDARVLAEAFRPTLHLAAQRGVALPLHVCRPLTEWSDAPRPPFPRSGGQGPAGTSRATQALQAGAGAGTNAGVGAGTNAGVNGSAPGRGWGYRPPAWRPVRRRPACPYPNPGRLEPGGALAQGMRVAFSGDTGVDRELLEDRATEAGLHVATSVSGRTSLLVSNDPGTPTSKVLAARRHGTPVVDEATFLALLEDVRPAPDVHG